MKYSYIKATGLNCDESVVNMVLESRGFYSTENDILLRKEGRKKFLFPIQIADFIAGHGIKCVLSGYKQYINRMNILKYFQSYYAEHSYKMISHLNYNDVCASIEKPNAFLELSEASVSIDDIKKSNAIIALINFDYYLERENRFHGHYILITSISPDKIIFHDPGPENAAPDRSMPINKFRDIWKCMSFLDDGIIQLY